jgi:hypothetical protein
MHGHWHWSVWGRGDPHAAVLTAGHAAQSSSLCGIPTELDRCQRVTICQAELSKGWLQSNLMAYHIKVHIFAGVLETL